MDDKTTPQDDAAMSPASTGSVADGVSDRSKPINSARLQALEQLSALDQELELQYGLTGNPLIKEQQRMRSQNCCYCEKPHGKSAPLIFQSCDACQDERDRRATDSSKSLTDEEREAIKWAAAVSEGLCQIGAMNRARTLRGILERFW